MAPAIYRIPLSNQIHQGAIYERRPIFWLDPPLRIARITDQHRITGSAEIYYRADLPDDFTRSDQANQEDVLARAKIRPIVVISNNFELNVPRVSKVMVAPVYSLRPEEKRPDFVAKVRANSYHMMHYLPLDSRFSNCKESFVSFREVRSFHKGFLANQRPSMSLADDVLSALLYRYHTFVKTARSS